MKVHAGVATVVREIETTLDHNTRIEVLDKPGQSGACHRYQIRTFGTALPGGIGPTVAEIKFQDGPVKETGVNGCQIEDLLLVVKDQLESFQAGPFACDENARALDMVGGALHALYSRTTDREQRGVEGHNKQ